MTLPGILVFRWVVMPEPEPAHAKLLAFRESEDIAVVYVGNATYHAHLAERIKEDVGSAPLLAAADIDKQGAVTSWKSSGFAFETPEYVREAIAHLLREHAKEIEEGWARQL
jgi:hypothetical protein